MCQQVINYYYYSLTMRYITNQINRTSTVAPKKTVSLVNKHTLEVQFINKKKQYEELISDLILKQKPVMELYRKLLLIKNQLETQGRVVHLDDLKVVSFQQYKETSAKTVRPSAINKIFS